MRQVGGTIMIEPTESEDLAELDRFCDAMICELLIIITELLIIITESEDLAELDRFCDAMICARLPITNY
jgi:glycine cleavage system protein P-like pyridoxal-binding family